MLERFRKWWRLFRQWPKSCGCGALFDSFEWARLERAYDRADAYSRNEARHCPCGSTLEIMIEVLDLEAE